MYVNAPIIFFLSLFQTQVIMKSKRMQSAEKFIQHFADNDNEVLHSLLADNLAYTFSPVRSVDNVRPFDKAGYLDFKELLKTVMTGYPPMEVVQYIDSESSNSKYCNPHQSWIFISPSLVYRYMSRREIRNY